MSPQIICQCVILLGAVLSAAGSFGLAHYSAVASKKAQEELRADLSTIKSQTDLIFNAVNVKPDVWTTVEINSVPPGVTDYLFLLFTADRGRVTGKVRVKGSEHVALFSTSVNDKIPVSVPNLWRGTAYATPTVIEFAVSEKTDANAKLSVLTAGWVDR